MTLELPAGDFKAYLFDCDGTIVDSMPLHYQAWRAALRPYGCEFSEQLFYDWGGVSVPEVIARLNHIQRLQMPVAEVMAAKEEYFLRHATELRAIPEVLEQIEANYGRIPLGVVSGSPRESVVGSLERLGLLERFETLVCAGEYAKGKPDPEAFLKAAAELGVAPEDCLVFEDADLGIQAATAAGMASVKVDPRRPAARGSEAIHSAR